MQIYQINNDQGRQVIVVSKGTIYNLTFLRPTIKTSLDLMMVAYNNGMKISDYLKEILSSTSSIEQLNKEKIDLKKSSLLPVDSPEVWAFGVTYGDSMKERQAESETPDIYSKIYFAERPESFFKSTLSRLRKNNDSVGIRSDSGWDIPEPELTFIIYNKEIIGFTCGNDMSSRKIEGENPLYLPQAKVYKYSASIGPCWVPVECLDYNNLNVEMAIKRNSKIVFKGNCNTSIMKRKCHELNDWLNRSNEILDGTAVMTGTGIIPPMEFSLKEGDKISISIENIGTLNNFVISV